MILSYVIKNNTPKDIPLDPGEAWKFIVRVDDEADAYRQLEKVKATAGGFGHAIMNVYLAGRPLRLLLATCQSRLAGCRRDWRDSDRG